MDYQSDDQSALKKALQDFYNEEIPDTVPEKLPLLSRFSDLFSHQKIFANTEAVFIQHHLGPLIPRVEAMVADGLDRGYCWFVDIPYSTNEKVRSTLTDMNYPQSQMTSSFNDPLAEYDSNMSSRVAFQMLKLANRDTSKRLLVIDDGAYFARFLEKVMWHASWLKTAYSHACIVEQTTRGHRFLYDHKKELIDFFDLRIVSIARCTTKTEFEGPFIGAAVARATLNSLKGRALKDARQIAIIGYGPVGKATTEQVAQNAPNAQIDIKEVDDSKIDRINKLGRQFSGVKELDKNKQYELVFGCTGYDSFRLEQRNLLADKALLVSGSSAAIEFNRAGFVELADRYPDDDLKVFAEPSIRKKGIHTTITIQQEGRKKFAFLNAGFPINFDGRMECVPTRIIQATHTLLYAAAIQSLEQSKRGIHPIREKYDHWVYHSALNEL
jgi:S-adenosylhomocysteine hydrolase